MQRRQKIPVPQCCGTGHFHRGWDLLLDEGQAVRALINRRIGFMGSNTNLIEGTVILAAAVVVALAHVALDCVVGLFVCKAHTKLPPFLRYGLSMCANGLFMLENFLSAATAEPASTSSETSAASAKAASAAAAGSGAAAETAGSGARPRAGAVVVMMVREQ